MTTDTPDWIRLQKALAIEAEQGFTDLLGKQYRFSEFLTLTFGKFPTGLPSIERRRWQELAAEFANYPNLAVEDRQHLVAETRRYLYQLQQAIEGEAEGDEGDKRDKKAKSSYSLSLPKSQIVAEVSRRLAPNLDQKLSDLPEIGVRKAASLARLGLYTYVTYFSTIPVTILTMLVR
jgi:ATP-dependent DNA helicase RecG